MAGTIALVACRALTQDGRSYVRGEILMTDPVSASMLVRARHATLIDRAYLPVPSGSDETPRRRYRRRDLQAEGL